MSGFYSIVEVFRRRLAEVDIAASAVAFRNVAFSPYYNERARWVAKRNRRTPFCALPDELVLDIALYLKDKPSALRALMCTSRRFVNITVHILYKDLTLNVCDRECERKVLSLMRTFSRNPHRASLVEEVTIGTKTDLCLAWQKKMKWNPLLELLEMLPVDKNNGNLRRIRIYTSYHYNAVFPFYTICRLAERNKDASLEELNVQLVGNLEFVQRQLNTLRETNLHALFGTIAKVLFMVNGDYFDFGQFLQDLGGLEFCTLSFRGFVTRMRIRATKPIHVHRLELMTTHFNAWALLPVLQLMQGLEELSLIQCQFDLEQIDPSGSLAQDDSFSWERFFRQREVRGVKTVEIHESSNDNALIFLSVFKELEKLCISSGKTEIPLDHMTGVSSSLKELEIGRLFQVAPERPVRQLAKLTTFFQQNDPADWPLLHTITIHGSEPDEREEFSTVQLLPTTSVVYRKDHESHTSGLPVINWRSPGGYDGVSLR